ncbi:MAG TPA: hypothetical protein VK900_00450 [Anaerolineales bacterium]|nr:hypothetical protein [Anaerolineales bacterium]
MDHRHEKENAKTARWADWREFRHLIFATLFGCVAIVLVALASWLLDEPAALFTREPQGYLDGPFYTGSFSNLGGLIWFAAAAIMSFAASLKRLDRGALTLAALLTWAMGVDDVFMLHDRVYPKLYLHETVVFALYFGVIGIIFLRYYRHLGRSTLVGIALAVFFWALSAAFDFFFNEAGQLAEDGSKFIGIAIWAAAWTRQAYSDMAELVRSGV